MAKKSKYAINWALSNVKEDEVLKWAIYLHYDKYDGMVYVGKTSEKPIVKRFAMGASIKGNGRYKGRFGVYLKTHRLEDMIHVVVDTTDDDLEAKRLEEAYTELYNSTDERYGFNSQVGDKSVPSEKAHEAVMESRCRYWNTIRHPNGEITNTDNLNAFCKEHNISQGNMCYHGHSKGYTLISKEPKVRTK